MASLNLLTKDGRPKERVLVTGVTGYVASHCVHQLLREQQYIVRGSVRDLAEVGKIDPIKALACGANDRLELVEADLLIKESWDQAVSGCDYVIHTACPVPVRDPKRGDDILIPAIDGALAVLEACRRAGHVKKVVFTGSALNVHDALVATGIPETEYCNIKAYTEDDWTELRDDVKHTVFVQSKLRAERAVWNFMETLEASNQADLIASASQKDLTTNSTTIKNNGFTTNAATNGVNGSPPTPEELSSSSLNRPHSNSVNRLLMKQSRHKASSSANRHAPNSFAMTVILPTFMFGPCLHAQKTMSTQLVHAMLLGGSEMPMLPDVGIEMCDVRDVARAHVRALKCRESDGQRILVHTKSLWLRDIAQILSREFSVLGYRVPVRPAPRWFSRLYTFVRRDMLWTHRKPHCLTQYSNAKLQQLFGMTPKPVAQTVIDMAHSLIVRGDIRTTQRYQQWLVRSEHAAIELAKRKNRLRSQQQQQGGGMMMDSTDDRHSQRRKTGNNTLQPAGGSSGALSLTSSGSGESISSVGLIMTHSSSGVSPTGAGEEADRSRENDANGVIVNNGADDDDAGGLSTPRIQNVGGCISSDMSPVKIPNPLARALALNQTYDRANSGGVDAADKTTGRMKARHNINEDINNKSTEFNEKVLKAAAAVDDDAEMENRAGRMHAQHNIDSESDEYEDAAESVLIMAEEGDKYKF